MMESLFQKKCLSFQRFSECWLENLLIHRFSDPYVHVKRDCSHFLSLFNTKSVFLVYRQFKPQSIVKKAGNMLKQDYMNTWVVMKKMEDFSHWRCLETETGFLPLKKWSLIMHGHCLIKAKSCRGSRSQWCCYSRHCLIVYIDMMLCQRCSQPSRTGHA